MQNKYNLIILNLFVTFSWTFYNCFYQVFWKTWRKFGAMTVFKIGLVSYNHCSITPSEFQILYILNSYYLKQKILLRK